MFEKEDLSADLSASKSKKPTVQQTQKLRTLMIKNGYESGTAQTIINMNITKGIWDRETINTIIDELEEIISAEKAIAPIKNQITVLRSVRHSIERHLPRKRSSSEL